MPGAVQGGDPAGLICPRPAGTVGPVTPGQCLHTRFFGPDVADPVAPDAETWLTELCTSMTATEANDVELALAEGSRDAEMA
jgi:hypothetical protein